MEATYSKTFNILFPNYAQFIDPNQLSLNSGVQNYIVNELPVKVQALRKLQSTFNSFLNHYTNLIVKRPQLINLSYSVANKANQLVDKRIKTYEKLYIKLDKQTLGNQFEQLNPKKLTSSFRQSFIDIQSLLEQKYLNNSGLQRNKEQQIAEMLYILCQIYYFAKSDLVTFSSKHRLNQIQICQKAFKNQQAQVYEIPTYTVLEPNFKQSILTIVQRRCRPFNNKKSFFNMKIREIVRQKQSKIQPNYMIFIQSLFSKQRHRLSKIVTQHIQQVFKNIGQFGQQSKCKQISEIVQSLKRKFMTLKNNSYYLEVVSGNFNEKYKIETNKLQNLYYINQLQKYLQDVMDFIQQLLKIEEDIIENRKNFAKNFTSTVQYQLDKSISSINIQSNLKLKQIFYDYYNQLKQLLQNVQVSDFKQKLKAGQNVNKNPIKQNDDYRKKIQQQRNKRIQQENMKRKQRQQQRKRLQQLKKQKQRQEQEKRRQKMLIQKADRERREQERKIKQQAQKLKRMQQISKRQKQLQQKKRLDEQKKKMDQTQRRQVQQRRRKQQQEKRKKRQQQDRQRKKRQEEDRKKRQVQDKKKKQQQQELKKRKQQQQQQKRIELQQRKKLQEEKKKLQDEKRSKQLQEKRRKQQQEQRKRKQALEIKNRQKEQQDRKNKQIQLQRKKQAEQQKLRRQAQIKKKKQQDQQRQRKQAELKKKKYQQQQKARKQADQKRKKLQQQEKVKKQAQQKRKKQEQQKIKKQAQAKRRKQEEDERVRKQQQAKRKKLQQQEKQRIKKQAEIKKKKLQQEEKQKKEAQIRKKKEQQDRIKRQAQQKKKKDQQQKRKKDQQQRKKKQMEQKKKKQQQQKRRKQQEDRKQKQLQQKKKAQQKQKKQAEEKRKKQQQAKQLQKKKKQEQAKQIERKKKQQEAQKNKKKDTKKSAINYNDFDDQLIDEDQDVKKPSNNNPQSKPTKKEDDQYLQDYDDDFDDFSPDKEGQDEEGANINMKQLITMQSIKCLNEYMKGTSYARKNKPNLESFNNKNQYIYMFEQFIQTQKLFIFNDPSIPKAIYDFSKQLQDQNIPSDELTSTLQTIQEALGQQFQKVYNSPEINKHIKMVFPYSFKNDLNIYLVEVLAAVNQITVIFKQEPEETQQFEAKYHNFIQAFQHIFGIQNPQVIPIVVPKQTKQVLDTFQKDLPNLLLIFALHYQLQHDINEPIVINQYTIERFFYIAHILEPLYAQIQSEENIVNFYEQLQQKYSQDSKTKVLCYQCDLNDPDYQQSTVAVSHKFKQTFLADSKASHYLVLIQLVSQPEQQEGHMKKIVIYYQMSKQQTGKPILNYYLVCHDQNDRQIFSLVSDQIDDQFEMTVYQDFPRHNGLNQYSDWSVSLWAHVIQKRKMTPIQAFRALTFAMSPYFIAFKQMD